MTARGIDLEIVEEQPADYADPHRIVSPNFVAINGQQVAVLEGSSVDVKATEDGTFARLTVAVGRLTITQQPEQPDDSDPPFFEQLERELGPVPALAGLIFAARQELGQKIRGHSGYTIADLERLRAEIARYR